jgi:hypothetical protein
LLCTTFWPREVSTSVKTNDFSPIAIGAAENGTFIVEAQPDTDITMAITAIKLK